MTTNLMKIYQVLLSLNPVNDFLNKLNTTFDKLARLALQFNAKKLSIGNEYIINNIVIYLNPNDYERNKVFIDNAMQCNPNIKNKTLIKLNIGRMIIHSISPSDIGYILKENDLIGVRPIVKDGILDLTYHRVCGGAISLHSIIDADDDDEESSAVQKIDTILNNDFFLITAK
ncbi:hypothetical protein C2G38_2155584 [Gigaspora rosea]|uniref:Uncharacterized protein n=1 Tax=Gigaspora rosea TaxID=44941 RepID=A0A397W514_9GLOM|nr:hypothetical protein C2G38_2155584 [Gigaspora rosea]